MSKIDDLIQKVIEIAEDAPSPSFDSTREYSIHNLSRIEVIDVARELSNAIDDIYELLEQM